MLLFCAPAEFFQGLSGGGKGCRCFSIFSDCACGINISGSGGVSSHERGAGGGDFGGSLPSAVALLVCMPAGRKECVLDIFFFCASAVRFQGLGEWRKMGAGVSLLAAKALVAASGSG